MLHHPLAALAFIFNREKGFSRPFPHRQRRRTSFTHQAFPLFTAFHYEVHRVARYVSDRISVRNLFFPPRCAVALRLLVSLWVCFMLFVPVRVGAVALLYYILLA